MSEVPKNRGGRPVAKKRPIEPVLPVRADDRLKLVNALLMRRDVPKMTDEEHRAMTAERDALRHEIVQAVCREVRKGKTLVQACTDCGYEVGSAAVFDWVLENEVLSKAYAHARDIGYRVMADEIEAMASETHCDVEVQQNDAEGNPMFREDGTPVVRKVRVPLSADVIARNRLRVDTRKWLLSKMLPRVFGDKVTQEMVGPGGGPIQVGAVDMKNLRNLSDDELETMNRLMAKAAGGTPS